jgi:hypothetical protein
VGGRCLTTLPPIVVFTYQRKKIMTKFQKFIMFLVIVGACIAACFIDSGRAHADTPNCQSQPWGFLGSQTRTICDWPRRADGSWHRHRVIGRDAHYAPITCYGTYFVSCSGGNWVPLYISDNEEYEVNDGNVLPDEPAYMGG